jgi:hypothetical protein
MKGMVGCGLFCGGVRSLVSGLWFVVSGFGIPTPDVFRESNTREKKQK